MESATWNMQTFMDKIESFPRGSLRYSFKGGIALGGEWSCVQTAPTANSHSSILVKEKSEIIDLYIAFNEDKTHSPFSLRVVFRSFVLTHLVKYNRALRQQVHAFNRTK